MNDCPRQNPAYCRLRLFRFLFAQFAPAIAANDRLSPFTDPFFNVSRGKICKQLICLAQLLPQFARFSPPRRT